MQGNEVPQRDHAAQPAQASQPSWRRRGPRLLGLLLAVVLTSVLVNGLWPEEPETPDSPAASSEGAEPRAGAEPEPDSLPERILDDLAAGREPESQDNPNAGAPIEVIQASAGSQLPIGRVSIPTIGVETDFFNGVGEQTLMQGPGHWPGTPAPGQPGNAVLSGHRTTFTAPFNEIDELNPGDPITVERAGQSTTFAVTGTTVVPEAEYVDFVVAQPTDPAVRQITLFACAPEGDRTHRIVVQATAQP